MQIPLKIFQTWHTKDLPENMRKNVQLLKMQNPEFEHFLFDDNDCREFIKTNFSDDVLFAFDSLIPGAYKSDLWRYCVLYIHGGIYLDIKYHCFNGFKLLFLTDKEYFVKDRPEYCIYNAFMVTFPENEIMLKCIYKIVENVKAKNYEGGVFCITGPGLLGSFFIHDYINLRFFFKRDNCSQTICDKDNNDIEILTEYKEYPEEQSKFEKTKHYSILYYEKCIYN
jgi:mannosyltransferase OCH1-like enzyme